jgi:hypothetical protein
MSETSKIEYLDWQIDIETEFANALVEVIDNMAQKGNPLILEDELLQESDSGSEVIGIMEIVQKYNYHDVISNQDHDLTVTTCRQVKNSEFVGAPCYAEIYIEFDGDREEEYYYFTRDEVDDFFMTGELPEDEGIEIFKMLRGSTLVDKFRVEEMEDAAGQPLYRRKYPE